MASRLANSEPTPRRCQSSATTMATSAAFGVVVMADEAADRDQAADWLAGVLGYQRHVIAAVHFCQVSQLCPAEAALGGEEASVHRLVGEVPQPDLQKPLVIRADRPDEDLGSVWKTLEHNPTHWRSELGACVQCVTQAIGRLEHARLGDDRRDQLGRRHVEGEVERRRRRRRPRPGRAPRSGCRRRSACAGRSSTAARPRRTGTPWRAGQHGQRVGADLVGHVAVGGDPVGADDHAVDQPARHQRPGARVGDDPVAGCPAGRAPRR